MGKKEKISGKQIGFYLNDEGDVLRLHAETGDKMIRPPKERKRRKGLTAYKELQVYNRALQAWEAGVGKEIDVSVDGGTTIFEVGVHGILASKIGEEDGKLHHIEAPHPPKPSLNGLSDKARRLYYAMKHREKAKITVEEQNK